MDTGTQLGSPPAWEIVPAAPGHIPAIAAKMRPQDRAEVWASNGYAPTEALERSLAVSLEAWSVLLDGEAAAMWGVGASGTLLGSMGSPWLLATPRIHEISRLFLRLSRHFVFRMQEKFPRLENYVHAENSVSIRWLGWCGFTIAAQPEPRGVKNDLFYKFWRERCATCRTTN